MATATVYFICTIYLRAWAVKRKGAHESGRDSDSTGPLCEAQYLSEVLFDAVRAKGLLLP